MASTTTRCPGCGLERPRGEAAYDGKFHASAECWAVFCNVLEAEFTNALLFARVHQLSVDAYAAQHAGGTHPDKSVDVHLVGLHLAIEQGIAPVDVPKHLQRLATAVREWPHFAPPETRGALTVLNVAASEGAEPHAENARAWAQSVWRAWAQHHAAIAALAARRF